MADRAPGGALPERYDVLQSCRGLLACVVVVYHMTALTHGYSLVRGAYTAVEFFFVLSGFVIAAAYGQKVRTAGGLGAYVVRRIGRLYPLHLVLLLVWLGIEVAKLRSGQPAFQGPTSWGAFIQNLFLVQAFGPDSISWNYPAWSISVELWANLAAGCLLLAFGRFWRWGVAAALALLLGFWAVVLNVSFGPGQGEIDILINDADYVFGFFAGMLAHEAHLALKRWGLRWPWGFDLIAVAATVFMFRYAADFPYFAKPLAFCAVVLILAGERGPVAWVLKRGPLLRLGEISYSVYLTHALYTGLATEVIYALGQAWAQPVTRRIGGEDIIVLGGPWLADTASLIVLAATLLTSELTYRLIEDPARKAFNWLSRGWG